MPTVIRLGGGGGVTNSLIAELNATPGDVKSGKTFIGSGTKEIQTGTFAAETKSVTPSTSTQTVTPSNGKYLSSVTVNAVSLTGDAAAANVLSGKTFYNTTLTKQTGTMAQRSATTRNLYPNESVTYSAGYYPSAWTVNGVINYYVTSTIGGNVTEAYSTVWDAGSYRTCGYFACAQCAGGYEAYIYIEGSENNSSWKRIAQIAVIDGEGRLKSITGTARSRYWRIRYITNTAISASLCRGMFWACN